MRSPRSPPTAGRAAWAQGIESRESSRRGRRGRPPAARCRGRNGRAFPRPTASADGAILEHRPTVASSRASVRARKSRATNDRCTAGAGAHGRMVPASERQPGRRPRIASECSRPTTDPFHAAVPPHLARTRRKVRLRTNLTPSGSGEVAQTVASPRRNRAGGRPCAPGTRARREGGVGVVGWCRTSRLGAQEASPVSRYRIWRLAAGRTNSVG